MQWRWDEFIPHVSREWLAKGHPMFAERGGQKANLMFAGKWGPKANAVSRARWTIVIC